MLLVRFAHPARASLWAGPPHAVSNRCLHAATIAQAQDCESRLAQGFVVQTVASVGDQSPAHVLNKDFGAEVMVGFVFGQQRRRRRALKGFA